MSPYTVHVRLSSKQKLNAFETLKLKFCSYSVRLRNGPVWYDDHHRATTGGNTVQWMVAHGAHRNDLSGIISSLD